jgi:hypothetical protein
VSRFDALFRLVANEEDAARARDALPERLASRFQHFHPRARRRVPVLIAAAAAVCVVMAAAGF